MDQSNKSFLEKLYMELPVLIQKGIVSEETSNKIKAHYGPLQKIEKTNLSLIIFGILGTVLVSGGIILLIAHNWSNLSRSARTIISFTPLVLSIVINLWGLLKKKTENISWKESVSLFWMASIGISIALISQTYHIPGSFERFLVAWMLLSLPILYIHRSLSTLIGYILGNTIWVVYTRFEAPGGYVLGYVPLVVASLPIVIDIFRDKFQSAKPYILTWTLLPLLALGLSFTFHYSNEGIWIPLFGLFFSLIYLLKEFYPKMERILKRPLNTLGGLAIWIMGLVLSFQGTWTYSFGKSKSTYVRYILPDITYAQFDYSVIALLTVGTIFLIYKFIKEADSKETVILGSFGLICLAAYGLATVIPSPLFLGSIFVLFNLFIFCVGIFRVAKGIDNLDYLNLNTGLIMISSIIYLRFLDSDLSLSIRGIVFILIGSGFWLANSKIAKRNQQIND